MTAAETISVMDVGPLRIIAKIHRENISQKED